MKGTKLKNSAISRGLMMTAAATSAVLVLGACAGPRVSDNTSSGAASDSTSGSAVDYSSLEPAKEISFWSNHPGGSIDIEQKIIDQFTQDTGITVNLVTAGANYEEVAQKFQTAQVSGDAGDLVVLSDANWFTQYVNGSITPIDDLLAASDNDTSTYVDALYGDYLYEGSHYAVPFARSTPIFYYNKDQYAAAGITQAPTTWDEVKADSEKLKAVNTSDVVAFGFPSEAEYPAWTMSNLVWSYGGSWSNEWDFSTMTDSATVEALTFAQDGVKDGWAGVLSGDPESVFAAGGASQVVASTGSLKGILDSATFDVGVAYLPGGPEATTGIVPTGGAGLAVSASSTPEKQLAAAMLASYLTNSENTATFSAGTGYLPVRSDADMSAVYADNPNFEVAVEQLANTRSQDYARVFVSGGDKALASALQTILSSDADVTETMTTAQQAIQTSFDRDLADVVK